MRCNVTKLKVNLKGSYDTYECGVCLKEDESQEHVYNCKEIWKIKDKSDENIPSYDKIMKGNVRDKIEVARIFQENIKIQENLKWTKDEIFREIIVMISWMGPGDRLFNFISCLQYCYLLTGNKLLLLSIEISWK